MIPEAKQYPHSAEQEVILLGAILYNNDLMQYLDFLLPEDFYGKHHQDIFKAMRELREEGEAITIFTVPTHVADVSQFDTVGGLKKYMVAVMRETSLDIGQPISIAKSLKEMSHRRKLIEICDTHVCELKNANSPKNTVQHAEEIRDAVEGLGLARQSDLFLDNHSVIESVVKGLYTSAKPYSTGFFVLDEAMGGGLFAGKTYGIAARKKVGKTAMAATISGNLNEQRIDHLFICGEMSANEIQQRVISRYAGIFSNAFRSDYGKSNDCYNKITNAMGRMPKHTFYQNAAGMTFVSLRRACRIAVERKKVKGIIVDYWQLVGGKQKGQSTSEHLDEVAQWIADFARQHEVFIITMAQINQEGNTRGSEGIRLAFDQVFELHRDDITAPQAWLEMLETRYTPWMNIGDKIRPGFILNDKGPFFEESYAIKS